MAGMKFDFSQPSSFSDWANYAGFNRTTGEIEGSQAPTGIAPPANMSEMLAQRMQPAMQMMSGMGTAASQFGQGNMTQAMNTMKTARKPIAPGQTPAAQPQVAPPAPGYDYSHDIEQLGS